ncbi:WXG100 family type VII secretion target [Arthrobacter sp. CJ23]|uniref:WXG100 family type VII secretion target n=1 Tax=Arthrobacter sp. CJ23 TaxID=2972479 RepID=UPI00215BBEC5|nr:WXG100 family type VII secretion target [Arthrobacter sp. CJ23]UVJ39540.1 WXG100 family type VII secretion target [Arthrobacter sp. CJ23]
MAIWGADVEQLRGLGGKLQAGAEVILEQRSQLNAALNATDWKGPDSDKFRDEWTSQHAGNLQKVADALREASNNVKRNAEQQTQASQS